MIRNTTNCNSYTPAFKGVQIETSDFAKVKKVLQTSGYKCNNVQPYMTEIQGPDFMLKILSKMSRKSIESDNSYNLIKPNGLNSYIIAKTEAEAIIQQVLANAKIFVSKMVDL